MSKQSGGFTLPGESGYEKLTLQLAEKWGADVIRDSDGTTLSDDITKSGYGIYSTICIIRDHNEWAKKNMDKLQQSFLMTDAVTASTEVVSIHLMDGFFADQFKVNDSKNAMKYWEVWDRTSEVKLSHDEWTYVPEAGNVVISKAKAFHEYTVSFMAYRLWEEISMYNHVTNNWNKEHLMPIDPRTKKAQDYLYAWMKEWCETHPDTTVVRFTSLFYNFVWIWGSDENNRNRFSDWGSYDFTVSPEALDDFTKEYGYELTAEDFIHQGKLHVTHMPAKKRQRDYMEFTNKFVLSFGKQLVDLVHEYGKQAYVFYDDSWVGLEPYSNLFTEFGFDGLIKCVFSGYEARLCADVPVKTHELRLHPYLFPVGLGGAPTFMEGGNPTLDAKQYWMRIRRALMRKPVDRIGLGGYLHLVQDFPDFVDYIETVSDEFRTIKSFHEAGDVYTLPIHVAVLHSWGKLRSWTLSGHFHETYMHDLIHVNEALAGLPVDVKFIDFNDVKNGALKDVNVVINAGRAGSAWSGGDNWADDEVVAALQKWVYEGGTFIGIKDPSATDGFQHYFRLASVLGVDKDMGDYVCHGKWPVSEQALLKKELLLEGIEIPTDEHIYLTDKETKVLCAKDGVPQATLHTYGAGTGIYLGSFSLSNETTRMLLNLMLYATKNDLVQRYLTSDADTECAYYPANQTLVVFNNAGVEKETGVLTDSGVTKVTLAPYETKILKL